MDPERIAEIIKSEIDKRFNILAKKTYYRGEIDAVNGQFADVLIEGSTTPHPNIMALDGYTPKIGDKVLILSIGVTGSNYVILGSLNEDPTLNISVDSNGWTVYDYGSFKQYRKKGSTAVSMGGNGWIHGGVAITLPTDMASLGTRFVEANISSSDSAVTGAIHSTDSSATSFTFQLQNKYSGTVNCTMYWSICITEK